MSSLVTQVLQRHGQFEHKAIHEKVDTLTSVLKEMTVEVHQLAESKYVDFKSNLSALEQMEAKVGTQRNEISELEDRIKNKENNQLSLSATEFQNLNAQLIEAQAVYEGLQYLAKIVALLQDSEKAIEEKSYSRAATAISEVEKLLKLPLTNHDDKVLILEALKTHVTVSKAQLDLKLVDLWKGFVKWDIKTDKKISPQQDIDISSIQEVSLCVTCEGSSRSELRELVKGLQEERLLELQMRAFADRFKKFVVPLIVECPQLKVVTSTSSDLDRTLVITPEKHDQATSSNSKASKSKTKSSPESDKSFPRAFNYLLSIMTELNDMLLSAEVGASDDSTCHGGTEAAGETVSRGGTLMSWLGQDVGTWMLDLLQRTVVAKAVPTSSKDLDGFQQVISMVEKVHDTLSEIGFIQPDNQILLSSVQNVNMLFSNKKSQTILVEARDLMTSQLHDSIAVTEDKPMGEWPPLTPGGIKKVQRLEVTAEHQLSDSTFRMPRCRISETIQTLITLAYETLHEASDSSPECSLQMYLAIRSMFEMFCEVVPTHHGHSLEAFPQIAALHHNNCMFIAHHLMTLGHQFAVKLPHLVSPTFVDLIQHIRENGVDVFLAQICRQQSLLLECMEGAQGFAQLEDKVRCEAAGRSIKQVLLQLEHLQKIWKPVLPINNYKKAMGRLINCTVDHITNCVCSLEDIAQTAGQSLVKLLRPLEEQCGEMLVTPGEAPAVELSKHVSSWARLTELRLVLDASLSQVGDRWAGGKGPLALAFKPTELRQLVRALFQNTDRRAALLATIK